MPNLYLGFQDNPMGVYSVPQGRSAYRPGYRSGRPRRTASEEDRKREEMEELTGQDMFAPPETRTSTAEGREIDPRDMPWRQRQIYYRGLRREKNIEKREERKRRKERERQEREDEAGYLRDIRIADYMNRGGWNRSTTEESARRGEQAARAASDLESRNQDKREAAQEMERYGPEAMRKDTPKYPDYRSGTDYQQKVSRTARGVSDMLAGPIDTMAKIRADQAVAAANKQRSDFQFVEGLLQRARQPWIEYGDHIQGMLSSFLQTLRESNSAALPSNRWDGKIDRTSLSDDFSTQNGPPILGVRG
jgi:hypothetical protein